MAKKLSFPTHYVLALALLGGMASDALAQDSSLLRRRPSYASAEVLTLENGSLIFQKPKPRKTLDLHDSVTVIVSLNSRMLSEGEAQNRKTANLQATLADWIGLDGLAFRPDPQTSGDPKIDTTLKSQLRVQADLETRNTLTFTIQAEVVDVRPNGNLVIEARQEVVNNQETWEKSLSGIIRREDVNPDNTITSDKILDLKVFKRERGAIRDGYRRGWLMKLYDRFHPI